MAAPTGPLATPVVVMMERKDDVTKSGVYLVACLKLVVYSITTIAHITPQPHNWPQEGVEKKRSRFQAGPPSRSSYRPRQVKSFVWTLASPDSPSPCASLATPLSPVGCACGEQRQSRRNRRWGKIGGEVGHRRHLAIYLAPIVN